MACIGYGRMLLAGAAASSWLAATAERAEAGFVFSVQQGRPHPIAS